MIVRALDVNGDWVFGIGTSAYLSGNAAIAQDIQTRLSSFLGDCFFDTGAGIDWFNLLGGKDLTALNLAVAAVILNTNNVTGGLQLSVVYNPATRSVTIKYQVQTTYSQLSNSFEYDLSTI
jgi:hypothetical protein